VFESKEDKGEEVISVGYSMKSKDERVLQILFSFSYSLSLPLPPLPSRQFIE
jgi:hypothetical protein